MICISHINKCLILLFKCNIKVLTLVILLSLIEYETLYLTKLKIIKAKMKLKPKIRI